MKTIIFLLFAFQSCLSQTKSENTFIFENEEIKYTTYYFNDKIYSANSFYVMIDQNEDVVKCLKNRHIRPYFLNMPLNMPHEKQEKLFVEFISYITDRTKLINSKFYIITDKKYSGKYREIFEMDGRYNNSYMNPIEQEFIQISEDKICNMLH